jgi:ATP-binding cassette subfamily B protein
MGHLRRHRRDALGALLSLLLVTAASLVGPQLVRLAIDEGIAGRRPRMIVFATVALVGVAALRGLFNFFQGYLAERASQGVAFDLREALFEQIQRLSFSYYDQVHTGQLLTRVTNDVEQIRGFAGSGVIQLFNAALMLAGTAALLFAMNWRLALLALLIVPLIVTILLRFIRRVGPLFGKAQQTLGQLNSVLQEDLTGLRVVRAFAQEEREARRFGEVNESLLATNLETVRVFSNHFPFVFLCSNLGTVLVVWFGGWQVIGGKLTVGALIAFNTYLAFLLMPLFMLGFLSAALSRAGASASRV